MLLGNNNLISYISSFFAVLLLFKAIILPLSFHFEKIKYICGLAFGHLKSMVSLWLGMLIVLTKLDSCIPE